MTCSEGMMGMTLGGEGTGLMAKVADEGVGPTSGADALVGTLVSCSLVVHDTGATSVTLPAGGGTISVDVVISSDAPTWGFEARLAADAANVVSINAADWTELENVLFSNGVPGHNLGSSYDLTVLDWVWVRIAPDGEQVLSSGMDLEPLLQPDPPTAWALANDLADLNGPIATPDGDRFVTSATMGGITRVPLPAGQAILVTLSLTITGTPGTYHVSFAGGYFLDEALRSAPMSPGPSLEVIVQGQ